MTRGEKFFGKPCRHGHIQEDGTTLRYVVSGNCVACHCAKSKSNPTYKAYQHDYHQMLRRERPDQLATYYANRIDAAKAIIILDELNKIMDRVEERNATQGQDSIDHYPSKV
jgi:hypothetical protein